MVWQSLLSSLFPTTKKQGFTKLHDDENRNSDRPLVDHQEDIKIHQTRISTYGSGSLDATATTAMKNESSVLVEHGDSESDGIHKVNVESSSDNADSNIEGYYSCTWKEYLFSWRFVELILCVVPFSVLWMVFESNTLLPRMRPMPFQTIVTTANENENGYTTSSVISNAGEWESMYTNNVWNPVNTEKSVGETIGHKEYQILFGLVPWLLQLALVWCLEARRGRTGDVLHRTTCMYFVGIGATDFITNCVKYYVGYLRPVFLDICQPYYDENDSTFRCSNQHWNATDARMSFPSNHSGWSFCGMMLLSLYLEQNFGLSSCPNRKLFRNSSSNHQKRKDFLRRRNILALYRMTSFLCYAPMLFAVFCAASRVVDNRHFPADVIGGALLGGSVASLVFGIWFPQQPQQEIGSFY